jgi:hypothetical protein
MENTFGNETHSFRQHLSILKKQIGFKFGIDRFQALISTLNPSLEEIRQICNILHEIFIVSVSNINLVIIDESIIAYQPKKGAKNKATEKGKPIPVVFIPQKPSPNGIMHYPLTTFVNNPASQSSHLPIC